MATHSSILAWRIPWKEETVGLQSMESQRIRHDSVTFTLVNREEGQVEDGVNLWTVPWRVLRKALDITQAPHSSTLAWKNPMDGEASQAAVHGVARSWTGLNDFTFTFRFHALEKEMATHSSVLAWRIPGMGEPGGLPSLGSHRVGHD